MTMLGKKLLCSLLALLMLLTVIPAALAAGTTTLQVNFAGMYATKDGDYEAVSLAGDFDVYQGDALVGTLNVVPEGENTIVLSGADSVRLVPVMDTIPAGIELSEYGYGLSVVEGRLNIAPLTVYANAGLFVLTGNPLTTYELVVVKEDEEAEEQEEIFMTFQTDEKGEYILEVAIAAGVYTLRMVEPMEGWLDQEIEIVNYVDETSILQVNAALPEENDEVVPTAEPTEAPTAEPTAEPTEAPAAEPTEAPTAEPTATPEPTATATAEPAEGSLLITTAEEMTADYTVSDGTNVLAEGTLSAAAPIQLDPLPKGEYVVTLNLAEDVLLTALNGNATTQRGAVRWRVAVNGGKQSVYQVELTQTGAVSVPFIDVTPSLISMSSSRSFVELTSAEDGTYTATQLVPGTYTLSATIPAGSYNFDTGVWQVYDNGDGTYNALSTFEVRAGETTVLLPMIHNIYGSVEGVVLGLDGQPLANASVVLYYASGQHCITVTTDANGSWTVVNLSGGQYVAKYVCSGQNIPDSVFTVSANTLEAHVTAQAIVSANVTIRTFVDENNDGTKNKSEEMAEGVEAELLAADGSVVASGKTDENGLVTLSAAAGTYTLRLTAPEDYGYGKKGEKTGENYSQLEESAERIQTISNVSLSQEQTDMIVAGIQPMASVTGTVWNDLNADGVWQSEEPGIPGVCVTIRGTKNGLTREVYTDEKGFYKLPQLKKGSYELTCYVPDEYVFTVKGKGDTEVISRMTTEADRAGTDNFSLERGENYTNHNIGMMEGVIIEGICFEDANSNGVYDEGETPIPGVEIRLARQSNNVLLQQTMSDENGVYHFYGQRGSTFTIRAILPSGKGYIFTATSDAEEGNRFAANGTSRERRLTDVTVENGGYYKANVGAVTFGSISGRVYFDKNFSSAWESGEAVGQSYLVTLTDKDGNKISSQKTDKNGMFTFEDLKPGEYLLKMTPEKGYAFTALGTGNVMTTLPDGQGQSRIITLGMGEAAQNVSIGMIVPAVVSGVVFGDENNNGLMDDGEVGLADTVVRLMGEGGEAAVVTVGADGAYKFNAVLPGTYYLQYELPSRAVYAPVVAGGNTVTSDNSIAVGSSFTVKEGDTYTAPLCGGALLSDIGGTAFADSNGNGAMDEGEAALAGVCITLTPANAALTEVSVTTGEDGSFVLRDLHPDTYTLTVVCPDGYVLSRLPYTSLGLTNGLISQSIQLEMEMGTHLVNQLLGCVLPSRWTGEAYLDENYDGLRAANEAPAAGECIELRDADTGEVLIAVLTDENGCFAIEGIAPGEYELVYAMDEGNLVPKAGSNDLSVNDREMTTGRVRVNENEDKSGTVIAVVRTTEIAGTVWLEKFDGVTPISGAKVYLLDAAGAPLAEFTTAEDGKYSFKELMPGEYILEVKVPSGHVLVESDDPHLAEAGLVSVVTQSDGLNGKTDVINLRMAKHQLQMDIGTVLPGRLGDKVWLDLNGNGLQDGNEGGIPGVTIELLRGDQVVATTVSDQYGYYVFENLYPAEYTLRVTWPAEIVPTLRRTDVGQIVSVLQENGLSAPVVVESNKANYAADLGFMLMQEDVYPAGYGEGAKQVWNK